MTLTQILADVKNMIGPSSEVSDAGLTTWIQDKYMYMCDEITKANPDYFTTFATASTIADETEYDLGDLSNFEKIFMVNISYEGTWVRANPLPNANSVLALNDSSSSHGYNFGSPGYYTIGSYIGILPTPTATGSNNIKVWYVYTPAELASGDSPVFPKKYHGIIKYGVYADYLDQDDEHAAADRMRSRFEKRVEDMVENLFQNQVDQPRRVEISQISDLYGDGNLYY